MACANVFPFLPSLVFSLRYVAKLSSEFLAYLTQIFCRNQIYGNSLLSSPLHDSHICTSLHVSPNPFPRALSSSCFAKSNPYQPIAKYWPYALPYLNEVLRKSTSAPHRTAPHRTTLIPHRLSRTHTRTSQSNMHTSTRHPLLRPTLHYTTLRTYIRTIFSNAQLGTYVRS